jgi:hypothetical protein
MVAEGRAPLVDFCNRYDPRAQLRNRPNPAHHARGRPRAQLSSFHVPRVVKRSAGGRASRHSQPRFHGPEACEGCSPTRGFPPPRSLAVEASPQPDRPGHLLSRARGDAGRSCLHHRSARIEHSVTRPPASPACAGPAPGPPHAISREGDLDPPHPRCLPSPDHPVRGWSLFHSLSPACG